MINYSMLISEEETENEKIKEYAAVLRRQSERLGRLTDDIYPSELMERFTRGDSARSSEGNGLGLAIAKSMAELQGGKLEISIDGDLFKAQLRFRL